MHAVWCQAWSPPGDSAPSAVVRSSVVVMVPSGAGGLRLSSTTQFND